MSDASSTSTTATASTNIFTQIEADLSADWQKFLSFISQGEQSLSTLMSNIANGVQILDTDIQTGAQVVLGKLASVNSAVSVIAADATALFPSEAGITTAISAVTGALAQAGNAATAITNGTNPSGTSGIVTDFVNVVNSLPTVSNLANDLSSLFGSLVGNSPSATQTTSAPTPAEG